MDAIVAYYQNWGIGKDGSQPIVVPEDRKRFQELTEGSTVIVGRRTFEDFPGGKPLKNRNNVVLTSQDIEIEGATVMHSVKEVLDAYMGKPNVYVIGGASVYSALIPYCEKIHLTKIFARPECDAYFLNLDENFEWCFDDESDIMISETGMRYQYLVYEKYIFTSNFKKI